MARSTKSYEERMLQLEKKEQESLEKAKQYAAQKRELKKRQKDVETKRRTHRLCQIGGAVESVLGSAIEEEDIPQSLREMIKGGEKKPFRITYSDQGFLYIAQGYEVQPTTGYSVEVKELYETETAVCIKTTLIGPKKGEEKEKAETYPYIVVQTEDVKKDVLFK